MTKLLFIRHGQSESNLMGVFTGHTNVALTELGRRQAEATANYVIANYQVDCVYASDLQRAYQTGKAVADKLGLPVIAHTGLREIFAGEWEGQSFAYLYHTYPVTFGQVWRNDVGNSICDGGESVAQLQQRVAAAVLEIARANRGRTVVIATHATPIRTLECLYRGLPLSHMQSIPWVTNASVTQVHWENGVFTEVVSSYDQHLGEMISALPKGV